ncbi:hypothetical protein GUJ93_ZPchr0011g27767 [Zizania palustris]|uniref:Uncharacterized protein n=1 Tax=Zizania palustris TaxID=103762 RepID=A0A8J6BS78_ZIZPA|nr:hypothetical protein GUJ93_ZPchr0011g27767 [Zizania palustris]
MVLVRWPKNCILCIKLDLLVSYLRTETDNIQLYVNKWLIQIGEHMLSNFWILKKDYEETPAMMVMMTWHILLFIQQNFLLNLYKLVVSHFLACCSQPAVGAETTGN